MTRSNSFLSLLIAAVAVSRYAFRSHFLYDLDSVNFALGMRHFDPRVHQPHPPGYFLYIVTARLLAHFVQDANLVLVLISIAASCGAVFFIYWLAVEWFGESAARFAGMLFAISPLAWFYGIVGLTYCVEAFFSALIGFLCWHVYQGRSAWIPFTGCLLGIAAGVRPSSLVMLAPLFLFATHRARIRAKLAGFCSVALALCSWCIPMIRASGGNNAYFAALSSLWHLVPGRSTAFNSSPANSIARAITILAIYALTFGAACLLPLLPVRSVKTDKRIRLFTAIWVAPSLCFFTFIFLKFVNSGYLLLAAVPGYIWLGKWLATWYLDPGRRMFTKAAVITAGTAANIAVFLYSPLYCSYRSVRRFESEMQRIDRALPQIASADDTLLVAFDSHFLGFRHAGYSLPQYRTIEYPEVHVAEGVRVFTMKDRETTLQADLSPVPEQFQRFVLFPLPSWDPTYTKYLASVLAKLPPGSITVVGTDGISFMTGPVSCLALLFPKTMHEVPAKRCVCDVSMMAHPVNNSAHN